VFAKALAHYAQPTKSFLDALSGSGPTVIEGPSASDALAAHHLVDLAYRSAAGGGVPLDVDPPDGDPTGGDRMNDKTS
jgi:hypothetical protein